MHTRLVIAKQVQWLRPKGVAMVIVEAGPTELPGMAQLINLIQTEPVLCDRLVGYATANAAVGFADGFVSQAMNDAVSRLGAFSVGHLALGFSLMDQHQTGPCPGFDYGGYWSRALLMGTALQELGSALSLADGDELFCTGFLARIGTLALAIAYPQQYGTVLATGAQGARLRTLEQKFIQQDHISLSQALLTQWGVKDEWVQALRFQEEAAPASTAAPSRAWQLGQILELALRVAELATLPAAEQALRTTRLLDLANSLGLNAAEFGRCVDAAVAKWQGLGAMLGIQTVTLAGFDHLVIENLRSDKEVDTSWLRVLVVEDDVYALRMFQVWLAQTCGYTVKVAVNGVEALAVAEEFLPHVVLTDWRMPEMNGMELCAALRSSVWGRGMYVVMLTGADLESDLVQAFNAGVDDYLIKPVNLVALRARLKAAKRYVRLREAWEQDNARLARLASELALSNRRLQHSATTDSLTELLNRRAGLAALTQAWGMVERHGQPLTVITNDIDHFKAVNDVHGHAAGDAVLQQFARCLRSVARNHETVCRWGGEEFLVILPNIDLSGGQLAAERLRKIVEATPISFEGHELHITASFGVASWEPALQTLEQLLALADRALYAAKAAGRNRVCVLQ